MKQKTIGMIGTLDTKGEEYEFLQDQLESRGVNTLMIDVGTFKPSNLTPDISAEDVALAAGEELQDLVNINDRGHIISVMGEGAKAIVKNLFEQQKLDGLIAMGGGNGTTLATSAMKGLPIGVPKIMVSTIVSGNIEKYVGGSDILMMPSIVDIAGINRFSSRILSNSAGAIVGMVQESTVKISNDKPLVAATMFGVTTPCVTKVKEILEKAGYEVLIFHAVGTGGRSMEELVRSGYIEGVLDLTTTELADELVGGDLTAGPSRMDALSASGVPLVVSVGALDMANFGPLEDVPKKYQNRNLYKHNDLNTLMRTTVEENKQLGEWIAKKLNKAKNTVSFMIPKNGVSLLDREGQPFHDPEADAALFNSFKSKANKNINIIEIDSNINDEEFAIKSAKTFMESLKK